MKKITLLCLSLFAINTVVAQQWNWFTAPVAVEDTEMGSSAWPSAVLSDQDGNTYVNWVSSHPIITFGDQTFTGTSYFPGRNFLIKYNNEGEIVWINDTDAQDMISTNAAVLDAAGNIYSAGEFTGTYDYDGYTFDSQNAFFNSFISKTDNNGNMLWAKQVSIEGNPANQDQYNNRFIRIYDIILDNTGNMYICGQMRGTAGVFDNITVPVQGEADTFIAKYDNSGNALWVKTAVEHGSQGPRQLACDGLGNVYLAGHHGGDFTITFGDTTLGGGTSLIFLVKYSPTGDLVWLKHHGGEESVLYLFSYNVAVDPNDNIYMTGLHNYPSLAFDDVVLATAVAGQQEGFVVKYNNDGDVQWAKTAGASSNFRDIKTDNSGGVYILGSFWGPQITFGQTTLENEGTANGYIAKMDTNGNNVWAEHIGGESHGEWHMAVNSADNSISVAGNYTNARFGDQTYTSSMPGNIFLARFTMTPLATTNFSHSEIKLYPNPATEVINISGVENTSYSITDITGRIVAKGHARNNSIDVSALPSGLYFLNINNTTTKFIKE